MRGRRAGVHCLLHARVPYSHLHELVGLTQAVPRTVVVWVHVDGLAVGLDGGLVLPQLDIPSHKETKCDRRESSGSSITHDRLLFITLISFIHSFVHPFHYPHFIHSFVHSFPSRTSVQFIASHFRNGKYHRLPMTTTTTMTKKPGSNRSTRTRGRAVSTPTRSCGPRAARAGST